MITAGTFTIPVHVGHIPCWLIETWLDGKPVWWKATGCVPWTMDSTKAVWFSREDDARRVIDSQGLVARATEHFLEDV